MRGLSSQQSFSKEPQDTSVILGEDVTLACSVRNQKGDVTWCKDKSDSFCTFGRKRIITDPRISFEGEERMGMGTHNGIIKIYPF